MPAECGSMGAQVRRNTVLATAALILATALAAAPAWAEEPDLLSIGAGWYDINDDKGAADFRLEYRPDWQFLWHLKPWAGLAATSDGAVYGAGGVLVDFVIGRRLVITPSFGAGLYANGGGKDLGHVVQFRSQLEIGYRFDSGSRLSAAVSHISNASLDATNPGTEIATIYYHLPLDSLFGE